VADRQTPMLELSPPQDRDLRTAAGDVAMAHGLLEYMLQMTIKSLAGISGPEARLATSRYSATELRACVKRLAKSQGIDEPTRLRLGALLERAGQVTAERNRLIHRAWGESNGRPLTLVDDGTAWEHAPSPNELTGLANRIWAVAVELNRERIKGFLREAIDQSRARAESGPSEKRPSLKAETLPDRN
jgi:hypothetical protein